VFIQHVLSSLNEKGQAAIVCSQGILFRGGEEQKIREGMITDDVIEVIIALPEGRTELCSIPKKICKSVEFYKLFG
jgi:type I restriction enzyme M protein